MRAAWLTGAAPVPRIHATSPSPARTCDNTCINTARATIRGFTTNQPVGVLAECGSIGVIEGTADVGGDPTAGWWYPPVPGTGDPDGGYPNATVASPPGQLAEQIATCTLDTTTDAGGCLFTATPPIRGTRHEMNTGGFIDGTTPLRNCTDPNLTSGNCVYYDHPQDPYSQTGDQSWYPRGGLLSDYQPNTNATYNSSWTPLAFAVANVNQNPSGDLVTPATRDDYRAQAVADLYSNTISPLSNSAYSSSIVYLGGHSYASDVAGSRVVLNTMLAIGARTNPLETAVASATAYGANLYSATYFAIPPGQNIPFQENHFTPSLGSLFQFPFHHGDIQGHGIFGGANQLGEGSNGFDVAAGGLSAQSALPATNQAAAYKTIDARNIFTYLGGTITSTAGNGGAQTGWTPVDMDYPSVLTSSNCLDVMRIGEVNSISKPNYTGTPYAGMLLQRDGVCDLQEALALTPVPLGVDHGTAEGIPGGLIAAAFNAGSEVINAEELVQIVRGYCYATVGKKDGSGAFQPRPTFCNLGHNLRKLSLPILGGFVHSQPAIIPASQLVTDTPAGKHRPTVMYAGGLDGMLHAFYVPSDGGDAGYSGPGGGLKFPSSCVTAPCDANSVFHTKYNAAFSIPSTPLTELWAFIPPGQLPYLKSNSAEVDSSPAVVDVFGDFGNTGVREWHTVLVASAGGSNREIFALDVTNPLKPVMLWDIQPNYEDAAPASLQYAPVWLADDDTGSSISITGGSTSAQAFAWVNSCRDPSDAACKTANFVLPPAADPGRTTTGLFNYQHVGASQGVSAAALRRNNAPLFAAFLATNEPQNQENSGEGLYTFAIDLVNGHKVWEFRNSYNKDDIANPQSALGNNPPDGVTLLSKAGNSLIDTAYVGDDHGSLWELDAADGINNTSYANSLTACTGGACNFALSQAYGTGANLAQPISTLSTVFVVPSDYPSSGPLKNYINQAMLAYGTAGTDTVTALEPIDCVAGSSDKLCITGQLHLLPIAPTGRYSATQIAAAAPTRTAVKNFGDAIEVPGYPIPLATGDRLFGSIVVAGSNLIFATNSASKTSSIDNFQGNTGATYQFKLGDVQSGGVTPFGSGSLYAVNTGAGGAGSTPLVVYDNPAAPTQAAILTVTNLGIAAHYINAPGKTFKGPGVNGQNQTPATFLGWFFRRRGSEY